ncbi:baculoviral iap repeat-containing protein 7 [Plakobranchus ocellatus]|uniref:Baculoviral iap repeat-containing protein 7 n=1 Tax=Plakobranchus ocellatus TaxID=259542 RepID=A0AAV4B2D7_9GAST|nr:baculoviral iap repeat-containing protein 7 [Plakobranchus ocellatus]
MSLKKRGSVKALRHDCEEMVGLKSFKGVQKEGDDHMELGGCGNTSNSEKGIDKKVTINELNKQIKYVENLTGNLDKATSHLSAKEDYQASLEKKTSELKNKESKDATKDSSLDEIIDHLGFVMKPQHWSVYMLDTVTFSHVGSIPKSWLREERWRLHTFAKYPHNTAKSAFLLAEAGFAYIGNGKGSDDTVICFFCQGMKTNWREDEDIKEAHRTMSPNCPMVTGIHCDNVPYVPATNVSFFLQNNQQARASSANTTGSDNIMTDGFVEARHISGEPGNISQHEAPRHQNVAAQPRTGRQLATQTNTAATASRGAAANNIQYQQAADEAGKSIVLTSSNTVPPYTNQENGSEPTSTAQVSNIPQATHSTEAGSVTAGVVNGESQTVSDSTQRASNTNSAQPQASSFTNSIVSQGTGNLENSSPISSGSAIQSSTLANQSLTPDTPANQSSTPAVSANQSSTPAVSANQSSVPNVSANQSSCPDESADQSWTLAVSANQAPPPAATEKSSHPTYHDLGIIVDRPKRYEYAVRQKRLETFRDWPADHHLKKEDLADAGFYYAGYGDCARCFFCGGGLRNWDDDDDVWVEHARWFAKCAFIRQKLGQGFVETVGILGREYEKISFQMVVEKMNIHPSAFQIDSKETPLKHDAAVMAVRDMGYQEKDILSAAVSIKENGQVLSADILYSTLEEKKAPRAKPTSEFENIPNSSDEEIDKATVESLKQTNNDLRLQTVCKICMDKEVAVVFLPCGHLVCCTECAAAMKDCPVCRKPVKGIVRAFMG